MTHAYKIKENELSEMNLIEARGHENSLLLLSHSFNCLAA